MVNKQRYKLHCSIRTIAAIENRSAILLQEVFTNIWVLEDEEELAEGVGGVEYVQGEGGDAGALEEPFGVRLQQSYLVGQQQTAVGQVSQTEPLGRRSFQNKVYATSLLYEEDHYNENKFYNRLPEEIVHIYWLIKDNLKKPFQSRKDS